MAFKFTKFLKGLNLVPNSVSLVSQLGDLDVTDDGKLNFHDGTGVSVIVSEAGTETLTNKTIDADLNTITNLTDANFSSSATIPRTRIALGTADQVVINSGTGALSSEAQLAKVRGGTGADNSSLNFPSSGTLSTLAGVETLTNKTLTAPNSDIINFAQQGSNPSTPSSGNRKLFTKSDGVYQIDDTGTVLKLATGTTPGDINNGGNSFGSNITIGTNDNFSLGLKVNNIVKYNIPVGTGLLTAPTSNTSAVSNVGLVGGGASSGNTVGGSVTLTAGAGIGTGAGGAATLTGGFANGSGGTGGALSLSSGAGNISGANGGNATLASGAAGGGVANAGNIAINGGNASGSGTGGTIAVRAGNSGSGASGIITLAGGNSGGLAALTVDADNSIVIGSGVLTTSATSGFISTTSTAGTPSGTPSGFGQAIPINYDSTNDVLYAYNSGWKRIETTKPEYDAGNSGAGIALNFNNGPAQKLTLTASPTVTFSNPVNGTAYIIKVVQGSGPFDITWPGNVLWPAGVAPVISTTNGDVDIINLYYDGTNYYGSFAQTYA